MVEGRGRWVRWEGAAQGKAGQKVEMSVCCVVEDVSEA